MYDNETWQLGAMYKVSPEFEFGVKGQGHQGQKTRLALPTPPGAYEWYTLAANSVQQQQMGPFCGCH